MHTYTSVAGIAAALLLTTVLSLPSINEKRVYDFDHNGIPDLCEFNSNGDASCELDNGSLTTFATATEPSTPPTAAPSAAATPTSSPAAPSPPSPQGMIGKMATGTLPSAQQFASQNGTSWTMELIGNLNYSGSLGAENLQGDKARSSRIGNTIIWNFGDMECGSDAMKCGFSMGPAMYDTSGPFTLNTQNINNINDALFVSNYSSDGLPQESGCTQWGMDNSNVAAINDTAGIVYSWEMYRGCPGNPDGVNKGVAVSLVTLGDEFPTATRLGPLLTGADAVQIGLLAILPAEGYIYSYTVSGQNVLVGRVGPSSADAAFSASNYEFLSSDGKTWVPGIPSTAEAGNFNMVTSNPGGWGCAVYGSVMYSNYFQQYMLFCDADELFFNFYTSDTPYGPWGEQYQILKDVPGYGSMVHPEYSPDGSNKVLYISQGPNSFFNVWKVTFGYDD